MANLDALIKNRGRVKASVTRIFNSATGEAAAAFRVSEVESKLELLEKNFGEFMDLQGRIDAVGTDEVRALLDHEESEFEDRYCATRAALFDLLPRPARSERHRSNNRESSSSENEQQVRQPRTEAHIKLPRLDLPTFTGKYPEWTSFHDLFVSMVHNNTSLSGSQKLHYLKSSLKDEAAQLLRSIQVTDANYAEAWTILKQRYHNKKHITYAHLDSLFGQSALVSESASALRRLLDTTVENVRALQVLGQPTDQWDALLVYTLCGKLDKDSRRQWELSTPTDEVPLFKDLQSFLDKRCRALETVSNDGKSSVTQSSKNQGVKSEVKKSSFHASAEPNCPICKERHEVYQCSRFRAADVKTRSEMAKSHSLCFNCLRQGHSSSNCKSGACRQCQKKHNTLLHFDKPASSLEQQQISVKSHFGSDSSNKSQVLLPTALVQVQDSCGILKQCRSLVDSGSQVCFITENCAQRLRLKRRRVNIAINGLATSDAGICRGSVSLLLQSPYNNFEIRIDALILSKITGKLPASPINSHEWSHLQHLQLADPNYFKPSDIDILLGAEVYAELVLDGKIQGQADSPTALNTVFGWILCGKSVIGPATDQQINTNLAIVSLHSSVDLDATLRKFWEIEDIHLPPAMTIMEKKCEDHFQSTHSRDSSGKFIVQYPFKNENVDYGNTRNGAILRLKSMERRLEDKPEHKAQYVEFMREYEQLGHMELIKPEDKDSSLSSPYYIPHHFVRKESSSTTKFRVVFDASKKTTTGMSLNDNLMVGPQLQEELVSLLLRFRLHKVAMTADIAKMYRQILVDLKQTDSQRIVWRESQDQPIKDYRLLTVTYGTASAPYIATKCLQQLAKTEEKDFPEAALIALRDFFMDDLMSGADSQTKALSLQADLIELLRRGGFNLRKWSSNDPALLESLPEDQRETKLPLKIELDQSIKTLGIEWHPASDHFAFTIDLLNVDNRLTKRGLLSDVARIFDPLGWLAPTVIAAKVIFQKLWTLGLAWDEPLPNEVSHEWLTFRQQLPDIDAIQLPRWIGQDNQTDVQLHGFSDASEVAYSAVVYFRSISENGEIKLSLLMAKTKVAPVKQVSIPRLELCGALLLTHLLEKVRKALRLQINQVFAWTDSTIVLSWLSGHPNRWKNFVANRVSEIQDLILSHHWHHVKSEDNPADCASRGIHPSELPSHCLWWNGPGWLTDGSRFDVSQPSTEDQNAMLEIRKINCHHGVLKVDFELLTRFSSLSRLKRITALCLRFIRNCRNQKQDRIGGYLRTAELQQSLRFWIKRVQSAEFGSEISSCMSGDQLHPKSRLLTLKPFVDEDGLLRVGGRLQQAKISSDQKHPIILPRRHVLTDLIVAEEHIRHLHAGPQLLLAVLQRQFWILCGRDVVRRHIHKCIKCFRQRADTAQQIMGNLPAFRTQLSRPFLHTGVDYAGPITLRVAARRTKKTTKGYICLFVCAATKAIHLELVSDLSTDAFIAALRRFISRRGKCSDIYSDCGTNFVGANRELKDLWKLAKSCSHNEEISNSLAEDGISWHFNPPSSPHFGGLWEAGVKSVKAHLRRTVGNALLTFEEMYTVLSQIEACLNSRPLCPMSNDPSDLQVLTPGHFLIGEPLTAIPEPDITHLKEGRLSRWQRLQQLSQHFWNRWRMEYLSRLQQRPKWMSQTRNIVVGDLVLIKDDNLPPMKWNLGRVIQTYPGADSVVRVVNVKCSGGVYKQPIVKLCPLPIEQSVVEENNL